jgi:hypothetical protein
VECKAEPPVRQQKPKALGLKAGRGRGTGMDTASTRVAVETAGMEGTVRTVERAGMVDTAAAKHQPCEYLLNV